MPEVNIMKEPEGEVTAVVIDTVDEILDHANRPTTPPEEPLGIIERVKLVFKRKDQGE